MKADQVEDLFEDYEDMSKVVKYHIVMPTAALVAMEMPGMSMPVSSDGGSVDDV